MLNEQWAVAKIANNHAAATAITEKLEVLSKYGGQYSALRDDLVHSRGRLNYVLKKLNEHKLTAQEKLEHKFIVNAAVPDLKKLSNKMVDCGYYCIFYRFIHDCIDCF